MKNERNNAPGKMEAWLSMGLLVLLSIVGTGVYLRQFEFNPAVLEIRTESSQVHLSSEPNRESLIDTTGSTIVPFSPPEQFGPDNLYEKINGRADLYLATGFVALQTQRFTTPTMKDQWVEVFIYDMGRPENAFSVFSMQRRTDANAEHTKTNAYDTQNALFMVHGDFYLELIGTNASEEGKRARAFLSKTFKGVHGNETELSLPGASLFPKNGFDAGSLQLISANAFGHENLDQVYTGDYVFDGMRSTAFVSVRADTEAAVSLANDYRRALLSYGAKVIDANTGFDDVAVIQFFDTYEIIFSRGQFFAGVHEAGDLETAIGLTTDLWGHLEELRE